MRTDTEQLLQSAMVAERYLKALSNRNRLMILCALRGKELSVSELNQLVALSQSALSQHLALLRKNNFVSTRKVSQVVYYQICDMKVSALIDSFYTIFCD